MTIPLEISGWKPAPFALGGETVFAVGDVHGCIDELQALLRAISVLARESGGRRSLVYLGDLIDRGADTIATLRLWAEDASRRGVDRVERIIGNHEIMMLLALERGPLGDKAASMWLSKAAGGDTVLAQMRAAVGDPRAPLGYALAAEALGEEVMSLLRRQRSHLRIGNALFVHGGIDGREDTEKFLAPHWSEFTDARWAWITRGFLDWQDGFGGTLVVHGHTPPAKHWPLTHMEDPHLFLHDRLGLDGGSAVTGIVVGAEIRDGGYRILKAGNERSTLPA